MSLSAEERRELAIKHGFGTLRKRHPLPINEIEDMRLRANRHCLGFVSGEIQKKFDKRLSKK